MKAQIVTTITTLVDMESMKSDHQVNISTDDPLPEALVKAVAVGAARSLLVALEPEKRGDFLG